MLTREEMRSELHDLARLASTMPARVTPAIDRAAGTRRSVVESVSPIVPDDAPSFESAPSTVPSLPPTMTSSPSWSDLSPPPDFRPGWRWMRGIGAKIRASRRGGRFAAPLELPLARRSIRLPSVKFPVVKLPWMTAPSRWPAVIAFGLVVATGLGLGFGSWMASQSSAPRTPFGTTAESPARASLHEQLEAFRARPSRATVYFRGRR
jgi:hypothetical protein